MEESRQLLRLKAKSCKTEETYVGWIRDSLGFAEKADRADIDQVHLSRDMSYLTVEPHVVSLMQQQVSN